MVRMMIPPDVTHTVLASLSPDTEMEHPFSWLLLPLPALPGTLTGLSAELMLALPPHLY